MYVAAGGGGDALAAAIVHRALAGESAGIVATYAWDRLAIDPLPGPRSAADFEDLQPLGRHNHLVTPATRPRPPAGSTLPRLAADLTASLALLDPSSGAVGMRTQLAEVVELHDAEAVIVLDVGGDALARGDEPGLRSPLADGLVLGACIGLDLQTDVLVAGPGLDGELPEDEVLAVTGPTPALRLSEQDIAPFRGSLDWHPSEATALLAAAARGLRGRVEVRDAGLPVALTEQSPAVFSLPLDDVLAVNQLAQDLGATATMTDAEAIARKVCGFSEIDYERAKSARLSSSSRPVAITPKVDSAVRAFEADARARGIDYVTFRRIAEATALGPAAAADLRRYLVETRPEQYAWPIWSLGR